ncbi:site-specific DNA-methyltransferase [Pseudomonas sp. O11]|uniref:site-specific DNA-methyltransferase n=1 Tax=Pseudomonas sp. O11 TaxID=3159446 RepID=UPI00387B73D5
MATGISKKEQHSVDSLTAVMPHRDPHPLPYTNFFEFSYPNKISVAEILEPLPSSFLKVMRSGETKKITTVDDNSIILADNYFGLHKLLESGEKATLIYLDPPYNTGMDFQTRDLKHAYNDQISDTAYIEFMRRRLILMREILSDDGSIYLHIGHQMVAQLKIVMDEVFGVKNFRNIITRRKCSSKNFTKHQYANINDYILFYSKTNNYKWNKPGQKPSDEWISKEYTKVDEKGQYKLVPVHAPGTRHGQTGLEWRGMLPPPGKHWQYVPSKLDALDAAGDIHWSKNGNPRRKVYLTDDKQRPYTDYWEDFRDAHHQSIVISGYPTEKNYDMLKMIVGASSDPGDLVLDPFNGSGTTMHAACELGRRCVGIDQSFAAIEATLKRLRKGLSPMGDYVQKNNEKSKEKYQDLFGFDKESLESVRASNTDYEISFIADAELLDTFKDEILELAAI